MYIQLHGLAQPTDPMQRRPITPTVPPVPPPNPLLPPPPIVSLIAGLVIRYGVSYLMLARPLHNIHCYVKYGLLMLQHPIPQWVDNKCRAEVV